MEARNSKKLKPKPASFSEPRFGGQRTLTQPFVSVRCPPNRGAENEDVFGFRISPNLPSVFVFFFVEFQVLLPPFLRNLRSNYTRPTYTRDWGVIQAK